MGVSGVGKTTVGELLAARQGWPFYDADDFHPPANVEKMRGGLPLNDGDRQPWLEALNAFIQQEAQAGHSLVLACSALKDAYRVTLCRGAADVRFVYLSAAPGVVRARIEARTGHFMNPGLLESQYATLEAPDEAIVVDAAQPPEAIVDDVLAEVRKTNERRTKE